MSRENTQLTQMSEFKVENTIFSNVVEATVPNTTIKYKRINIGVKNPDGTTGELIIQTPRLFSFGVSENKDQNGKLNGYSLPLCLYNRGENGFPNPTDEQKEWVDKLTEFLDHVKKYLLDNKVKHGDFQLKSLDQLDTIDKTIYRKIDKTTGNVDEKAGLTLYPKLIESKKHNRILTLFRDEATGNIIEDFKTLIKKYMYVVGAIKVESIYIGSGKRLLQVKMYNATIKLLDSGVKDLLPKVEPKKLTKMVNNPSFIPINDEDEGTDDDKGSLKDENVSKEEETPPPPQEVPAQTRKPKGRKN